MAEIYVKGIISEILPMRQGETEKGHWEAQEYVISPTGGGRPLCFTVNGHDRIAQANLTQGQLYVLRLYVESRQYPDKQTGQPMWFTGLSYGGIFGQPHLDFYDQAMYSLKSPGFGVSMGFSIQPVVLQQQPPQYQGHGQGGYSHQNTYGQQQGYGQQGGTFPPNVGPDGLPF